MKSFPVGIDPLHSIELCLTLLAFLVVCLVIISEWPPLSPRLLWICE